MPLGCVLVDSGGPRVAKHADVGEVSQRHTAWAAPSFEVIRWPNREPEYLKPGW